MPTCLNPAKTRVRRILMDLTKSFPRSPAQKLGPYIWLPRLIDKARASLAGTIGEYIYNCPMDQKVFEFLSLKADDFKSTVDESDDDSDILAWVQEHAAKKSESELADFASSLTNAGPADSPGETWFKKIDKEEGRAT